MDGLNQPAHELPTVLVAFPLPSSARSVSRARCSCNKKKVIDFLALSYAAQTIMILEEEGGFRNHRLLDTHATRRLSKPIDTPWPAGVQ
jgi:hypothetical protein